ncbi:BTB/POZ and TAZ domain-containing protein 4 [Linum grandiflorum]
MGETADSIATGGEKNPSTAGKTCPDPPPIPSYRRRTTTLAKVSNVVSVSRATRDLWERLFNEAYRSDVEIHASNGDPIFAHASVLGMASPVLRGMLKQAKSRGDGRRSISVNGVPHDAVRVFVRFLYSSCYEKEEMEEFVLHLLVLSHVFVVPELKRICIQRVEQGYLTTENVVDILQLALLCDAPRLSLICHRMIIKEFKEISCTEGWLAMKQSHPVLEKELLESILEADNFINERYIRASTYLKWLSRDLINLDF